MQHQSQLLTTRVIGLGTMGSGMALNLHRQPYE
jgi:3-hydroxyisobutyrate dehydrogenase-like beta-hydroxyacid dehydrogenase